MLFDLAAQELKTAKVDTLMMGSAFGFTAVHEDENLAYDAISAAIREVGRIENLISSWKESSETNAINTNAGIKPVKVSLELYDLIFRSKKISRISNGYFDISFASIDQVWQFNGQESQLPTEEEISESISKINYEHIILDPKKTTVFLKEKGMKIGFGAIGKGYAANSASDLMKQMGIRAGVVNAGGDLLSWGSKPGGDAWTIAIADPTDKSKPAAWLNMSDKAVVTSGDYERFTLIDGEKYCHIINPKTGWPVKGLRSVTIIANDAEFADALATTVFVLGESDGLKLINHLEGVDGFLVTEDERMLYSENLKVNLVQYEE